MQAALRVAIVDRSPRLQRQRRRAGRGVRTALLPQRQRADWPGVALGIRVAVRALVGRGR